MSDAATSGVVIGVGRNVGPAPMDLHAWGCFRAEVRACLTDLAADVHGWTTESDWGREESYWVAGQAASLPLLRVRLREMAGQYGQEAIALTVGTTQLLVPTLAVARQGLRP